MAAISMSGRGHKPLHGVLENQMTLYAGSWAIGATGAVGAKLGARGMSLTRTGVGLYTIQLTGAKSLAARVHDILDYSFQVEMNDDHLYTVKAKTCVAATGVITIRCYTDVEVVGGTPVGAELPSGAVLRVRVIANLSSSVR